MAFGNSNTGFFGGGSSGGGGGGITSINSLSATAQFLTTGTSGTNFTISSSGDTHVFNIPISSSLNTGLLSNTDWGSFNTAYNSRIAVFSTTGDNGSATFTGNTLNIPTYTLSGLGGQPFITAGTTAQYWRGDKTFQTLDTYVVPENGNLYFTNARTIASTLTGYVSGSGTVSSSDSVLSAIQKLNGNIGLLSGSVIYQGLWNANTNSPTLVSGVGTKGYYYKVSVAGTTNIDGISQWNVGDSIIFDGTTWDKIDGIATEVLSVNGLVGAVPLTGTANRITISGSNVFDISASYVGQNSITTLGTIGTGVWQGTAITDTYISSSGNWNTAYNNRIASFTTTGNSGAATFTSNTLNIPTYTLAGLGGQPQLNGTGFVKASGTTISYDNSTYLTTSSAASTYLPISNPVYTGKLSTGTLGYTASNPLLTVQSSVNAYNQLIIQNSSNGAAASSDVVVNNDNSTDTTFYGDFGMNSSGFSGTGSFSQPNYVFLTATSTDLAIGTTTNNSIRFVVNNGATDALVIGTTGAITTGVWQGTAIADAYISSAATWNAKQSTTLSAFTVRVNNTNASATATDATFRDAGQQAYTGSITWTGTTAPSGSTNHSYHWEQVGKMVTLRINLVYSVAGAALTGVSMALPTDMPNPELPTGVSGASVAISYGSGALSSATSVITFATIGATISAIRVNSGNNGFDIVVMRASSTWQYAYATISYYAA